MSIAETLGKIKTTNVYLNGVNVGTVGGSAYRAFFEYDVSYIRNGVSISPFLLPLSADTFRAKQAPFFGNFGVFDDSLSDGFGRLVFDRFLESNGIDPHSLTIPQRLSIIGNTGRGALEYIPNLSPAEKNEKVSFPDFKKEAKKILADKKITSKKLGELYAYGGTSGGARPKMFTKIKGEDWLIKFPALNDPEKIGKDEYKHSLLAKKCGIEMPETKLFEKKYFGVRRFDRDGEKKIHTISAAALLNADFREVSLDYEWLMKACHKLTKDIREVEKLFRLMVFNARIKNRDDHAKNFSFQLIGKDWKLSPAYDILPSIGWNGMHTTTINGKGSPTDDDIRICGEKGGLDKKRIAKIVDEVGEVL